ncbi:MAG: gliding motility-associated C-terminal domain-containing protein [Flavobacteriales bacterium]
MNSILRFCVIGLMLVGQLWGQTTVFSTNCDVLGGWTNTGRRYPSNQTGYNFQAVVPVVPLNDHTPGPGGGVFYTEGNNFYQQAGSQHYILYQLESPSINLTGYNDTRLEFFMQLRSETGNWDGGYIEWSTNGGASWILLNQEICPNMSYDGNMSLNPSSTPYYFLTHPAWFNFRTVWTRVLVNVSAYDNLPNCKVRFTFHSDEAANDRGWAIDDIAVVSVARIEVHGNGINIPPVVNVPNVADNTDFGQTSIGNPIIKTFWIVNPGESPLTLTGTPPVTVTGNGFSVVSQPSPTVVPAGDSVSFQLQFNPTQFGLVNGQVFIAHSDSYSVCNPLNPFRFNIRGDVVNTPPTIPNPPADTFVCINSGAIQFSFLVQDSEQAAGTLTLSASSSNPALIPQANLVFGGSGANRTLTASPIAGQTGTTTITVTVNDNQQANNTSTYTFTITVGDPLPPVAVCQNATVNLNSSNQAVLTTQMIDAGSTDNCGIQSLALNIYNLDCSHVPQTPIVLTATDFLGQTHSCTATVTVIPVPMSHSVSTSGFPSGHEISCAGASDGFIQIQSTGGCPPYQYNWIQVPGNSGASANGLAAGTYLILVSDAVGQVDSLAVTLTEPSPLVDASTFTQPSCAGDANGSINLQAQGGSPAYTYSVGPTLTYLPPSTTAYSILDINGCMLNGSITLTAPSAIEIMADPKSFALNCGESVELNFGVSGGNGDYRFDWNPAQIVSCTDCQNPIIKPTDNTQLSLVVTDSLGCESSTAFLFEIACAVYVPNTFTPNGDGLNDIFYVVAGGAKDFSLIIHDRWGNQVFESDDLQKGWNGRAADGSPYMPGIYAYQLILTLPGAHKQEERYGFVYLSR